MQNLCVLTGMLICINVEKLFKFLFSIYIFFPILEQLLKYVGLVRLIYKIKFAKKIDKCFVLITMDNPRKKKLFKCNSNQLGLNFPVV